MTQLLEIYNSRLHAYNTALDEKIAAASSNSERRRLADLKFAPLYEGEVSEDELRRRVRIQRLRLGSILKTRAVELLRHIEPEVLRHGRYTVGLSYEKIIGLLKQEFPEAQVTPACLRWYVSQIGAAARDLGTGATGLPQWRPRARPQSSGGHWRKVRAERREAQAAAVRDSI